MKSAVLLLMLLVCDGSRVPYSHQVDLLEVNHKLGDCGKEQFVQVILWEWSPDYRRYHVVCWWIVHRPSETPSSHRRVVEHGGRRIKYLDFRESWTCNDPERDNRELFPESERARLYENTQTD